MTFETSDNKPRHFARVTVPVTLALQVEIPADASKDDIKTSVKQTLVGITNADHGFTITEDQFHVMVHIPREPELNVDGDPIYSLRGLKVLDTFTN